MKRKNDYKEDENIKREQRVFNVERGNSTQDQRNKSQELKKLAKTSYFEQKDEWKYQKQYGNYNQRHLCKSKNISQEKKENVIDDKEEQPTFKTKNMSFDQLLGNNMISNIKQKVKNDNLLDTSSPYNLEKLQMKDEQSNQTNYQYQMYEQQLKKQLNEQNAINQSYQNSIAQLQTQLQMTQNQCQRFQNENTQYQDEIIRLRQNIQKVKQEKQGEQYDSIQSNERIMVQMNTVKQDYDIKIKQLEIDKINIEKDNQFELKQQKQEIQQLYQQNEELVDQNTGLNNELRTLNHQFYILMNQYNNLIDVDRQRVREKLNIIDNMSGSKYSGYKYSGSKYSGSKCSGYKTEDFKDRINQIVIGKPSKIDSNMRVSFSSNLLDNISIDNLSFKQTSRSKSKSKSNSKYKQD